MVTNQSGSGGGRNQWMDTEYNLRIEPTCFDDALAECGRGLLLLLSRSSRVQLCATPEMAAHQASPSLGFSRQEHWSGVPFPSPMHESEKGKWSRSVMSDSSQPHGLQPTRLLRPWDFPGKSTGVGCHCLLLYIYNIITSAQYMDFKQPEGLPWLASG